MNGTKVEFCYEVCEEEKNGIPVIVVAAGSSSRMGGINKQFLKLCSVPVIARTLEAFEKSDNVSRIILVVRDEDVFDMQMLSEKYSVSKLSDIVCGGKTRSESVLKGFARLSANEKKVLIHDGARPLVTEKVIESVINGLKSADAAAPAVKVKDTVKQVDKDGKVIKTVDRDCLLAVQTPQGVDTEKYLEASKKSLKEFTDDLSVMESAGYKCVCTEGDYRNIKITTRADIAVAESYLREENS